MAVCPFETCSAFTHLHPSVSCGAGNDAQMLEESDVAVAVAAPDAADSGAQLSCDISIPSFAVLPRLVQVHGSVIALRFQGLILLDLQV